MLDKSCSFTGHRPHKFPWKYDEANSRCVSLKATDGANHKIGRKRGDGLL